MIDYTWTIETLDRKTDNGLVTTAHWRCTAVDGEYSASVYGTVGFEGDHPTIPYADLTLADVLAWVFDKLDKDETEANLAAQIEAQKHPVQKSGVPWA
jgi:hypothetical protein